MNFFSDNDFNRVFLASLLMTGRTDAIWERGNGTIPGRFRIDAFEVPTGGIAPGIGEIQTWFYCDRRVVPSPLPELGDHLTIRDQVWEIVQRDEDDIGELGFRLIKEELGLIFEPPEEPQGDWDDKRSLWDQPHQVPGGPSRWDLGVTHGAAGRRAPGRPSRRDEITQAYTEAANAGIIGPDQPMSQVVETVRSRISGDRRGLGDKTLRRTIGPLMTARQKRDRNAGG
jgi:hypothetical protein